MTATLRAAAVFAAIVTAGAAMATDAATIAFDNPSGEQVCIQATSLDNAGFSHEGLGLRFGMHCLNPGETGATLLITAQDGASAGRAVLTVSCLPGLHASALGTFTVEVGPEREPAAVWAADPSSPCNTVIVDYASGTLTANAAR